MKFFVFQSPMANRARVHAETCIYCCGPQEENGAAMGWSGPFDTFAQADAFMRKTYGHKYLDIGNCFRCAPGAADAKGRNIPVMAT
jgi:hypothetical protein